MKKEAEGILKYQELTIERERMCDVKTKAIPEIMGPTGTISTSSRKYLNNLVGKYNIEELQAIGIMGQCTRTSQCTGVKGQKMYHGK
jgi:hypothetical protein